MNLSPAVIVHGRAHAAIVLGHGRPVTLLSAPGAAGYAGCLWWHALLRQTEAAHPAIAVTGVLDCADATGHALAALRVGLRGLVLYRGAPGRTRFAAIAQGAGVLLLDRPPPALDMAEHGAKRRLHEWLQGQTAPGESRAG